MPELRPNQNVNGSCTGLECVSSGTIRKFEWILRQFKEKKCKWLTQKSRVDDAEMAQRRPKLRIREFLDTLKGQFGPDMALEHTSKTNIECTLSKIIRWCNYERTDYYNRSSVWQRRT